MYIHLPDLWEMKEFSWMSPVTTSYKSFPDTYLDSRNVKSANKVTNTR